MKVRIQVLRDDGTVLQQHTLPAFAVARQDGADPADGGFCDEEIVGRRFLGFVFAPALVASDGKTLHPHVVYNGTAAHSAIEQRDREWAHAIQQAVERQPFSTRERSYPTVPDVDVICEVFDRLFAASRADYSS